jgi:serine/threonine protein kinase
MEFIHGKSVGQVGKRLLELNLNFPLECAVYIISEICKGLDYAHNLLDEKTGQRLNIVHRDVSPHNVMISFNGEIKLVDFGIAKAKDRADFTRTGSLRGTVNYMSPEVIQGDNPSPSSDIFSTGALLYELITGKKLFESSTILGALEMVRVCDTQAQIQQLKIPPVLRDIIAKSVAKDPKNRYKSAEEFRGELEEFLRRCHFQNVGKKLAYVLRAIFTQDLLKEKTTLDEATERFKSRKTNSQSLPKFSPTPGTNSVPPGLPGGSNPAIPLPQSKPKPALPEPTFKKQSNAGVWLMIAVAALVVGSGAWILKKGISLNNEDSVADNSETANRNEASVTEPPKPASPKIEIVSSVRQGGLGEGQCPSLIKSNPEGARIQLKGIEVGVTPSLVAIPCASKVELTLIATGYPKFQKTIVVKKPNGQIFFDLTPYK